MPSNLRHELRTPLNHIIGYCEMLIEEAEDKGQAAFLPDLQKIHAAGRHLLAVINDLFDSTKPAIGRLDPIVVQHDVRTPLNQIIGYAEMLQEEAHKLGQPGFIPDLEKILAAAEQLLELFIQNVSLSPVPMTPGDATGNPLTSAATFLRTTPPATADLEDSGSENIAAASGHILVVDDNEPNRDMLARRLERLGHKVSLAENGRHALDQIRKQTFDVVLLDIMMPVMTGYEVLEEIKSEPALRDLQVIVLSASDCNENVAQCIEMGAQDYLPKPFDPVVLQARLGACLEKNASGIRRFPICARSSTRNNDRTICCTSFCRQTSPPS